MNLGIAPPDFTSAVGRVRSYIDDKEWEELTPPEEGLGEYQIASDAEIEGWLIEKEGSTKRVAGEIYLSLASQAAKQSKSVKDYDLQIDLTRRAADLRATAQMWFDQADEDDDRAGLNDIFEFSAVVNQRRNPRPEATPYPFPYGGRFR